MVVVMVRIPVGSDEEGEALAERFRNRAGLVDSQPGFISFELLKGDGEYISVTRWADRGSLEGWMRGQAHGQAHGGGGAGGAGGQQGRPMGAGGAGSVSIYQVVIPGEG